MGKRFNYGKVKGTASRLLDRFQQGVLTLTRPGTTTPGPNPWNPPVESPPVVTAECHVAAAIAVLR